MTLINLSGKNLTTLEGLKWPSDITRPVKLNCSCNCLTSLKGCPEWIDELYCYGTQITSLEGCPQGLKKLHCDNNQLTTLKGCPQGLKELYCYNNCLITLEGCPQSLKILYCYNNQITSLKGCPQGLKELYCSGNQITSLSLLPTSVKVCTRVINPLEPFWRDKKLEEIHKIRYLKCLTHLRELVAATRLQRFWRRQYYDVLDCNGYSRYAKFVFREERDIIRA